jgi:hypothetical protein
MRKEILQFAAVISLMIISGINLFATDGKWVLNKSDRPAPGYIKFNAGGIKYFSLWDNYGTPHYIITPYQGLKLSNYRLLKNGLWICVGSPQPNKNKYYLLNQDLQMVDSIPLSDTYKVDVHEVDVLSNGHYLVLYTNQVEVDMSKLVEDGNPNARVNSAVLVETDRTGTVYWEWKSLEHISVLDATSDQDLRSLAIEFPHANSFCEDFDGNIIISFRHSDEIAKINRTTSALMWRMGGTYCKNNQFTFINDTDEHNNTGFSHQHSISILDNGNLLVYDNGNLKQPSYSRAVEYQLDQENKTATKVWEYRYTPDIFIGTMGSTYRLQNGNTLINWGLGRIIEVTPEKEIVYDLEFVSGDDPGESIYRAYRYITKMDAVTKTISGFGTFDFSNNEYNTGIKITVSNINNPAKITVEKHEYEPPTAEFTDSAFTDILPCRWVMSTRSSSNISGTIKFYIGDFPDLQNPGKLKLQKRDKEATGKFSVVSSTYNTSTKEVNASFNGMGEYILTINDLTPPAIRYPANSSFEIPISGKFTWDTLKGAQNYQLQVSLSSSFNELEINRIISKNTSAEYLNLDYLTKYYCRIRAYNSSDTSDWSQVTEFTTDSIPQLNLLFPASNFTGFDEQDSLVWAKIEGNVLYRIQIAADSTFKETVKDTNSMTVFLYNPFNLDYYSLYFWRARAYNGSIAGRWSETRSFRTILAPPIIKTPSDLADDVNLSDTLIWLEVKGATRYQAEISESKNFKILVKSSKELTDTIFKFDSLGSYLKYYWRVRAIDGKDTSAWSAVYSFTTIPVPPELLSPADNSMNIPLDTKLSWKSIPRVIDYQLQVALDNNFNALITDTTGLVSPELIVKDLPADSQIYWRVAANYGDKLSAWSEYWSFTTSTASPLAKPLLQLPVSNSTRFISGEMSWQPVDKADTYIIQVSDNTKFTNPIVDLADLVATKYVYGDLQFQRTYYWRVRAVNSTGKSLWSDTWILNTQKDKVKLISPNNDAMQVPLDSKLEWETIPDFDNYRVQIAKNVNFTDIFKEFTDLTTNTISIPDLVNNGTYYWRVKYYKNDFESNWSEINSFTTEPLISLPAPVISGPVDGQNSVLIDGKVKWNEVQGASYYKLSIAKDTEFESVVFNKDDIIGTEISYPVLDFNTIYYWRIAAMSIESSSPWSPVISFLTELKAPALIEPIDMSKLIKKEGKLIWQSSDSAKAYHLQVSTDRLFGITNIDENDIFGNEYSYILDYGTEYFWRIEAQSENNKSRWSNVWSFTTEPSNSVDEINNSNRNYIYPIPATNNLYISFPDNLYLHEYEIYSFGGLKTSDGIVSGSSIDISFLCTGCYYLKVGTRIFNFIKF